jgi:RNA polymerase sigma-70 factor (ECF subfamily)
MNGMAAVRDDRKTGVVDLEEARTIRRAKEGDMGAFESLYRSYVPRVFGLCLRMTGNPALAEEATQDVFVRLWEKLHLHRSDRAFTPWLLTLTANVVRSRWRTDRRKDSRETALDEAIGPHELEAPARSGPAGGIDLEKAIQGLPQGARNVFVLHDIEGYKHTEIAGMLGLATGTTKAQLHRARRMLREALAL